MSAHSHAPFMMQTWSGAPPARYDRGMSIEITRLSPCIGARLTGIDARRPLPPADVAAIEAAMDEHAVLVLPGQDITDEQQLAFSRNFGPLEDGANSGARDAELRLPTVFADVSNLGKDGERLARDNRRRLAALANRLWHSDASFRAVPAKYSILSGRIVTTSGGNTEFADMRAAYDALDARTKGEIEDMVCEHSLVFSRGQLGFSEFLTDERAPMKPVRQRLVRTHPVTGRKSLFLASHIGGIVGWPQPEAMAFILELIEHATQPQFVYAHRWTQFDLVIWDNRTTMHRVRRFDDQNTVRDMRRTTTRGDGPTMTEPAA
jgi:alpha-ketoglutarate-dependent 2,4-dichlorophenoxyacetate dioxygenase